MNPSLIIPYTLPITTPDGNAPILNVFPLSQQSWKKPTIGGNGDEVTLGVGVCVGVSVFVGVFVGVGVGVSVFVGVGVCVGVSVFVGVGV